MSDCLGAWGARWAVGSGKGEKAEPDRTPATRSLRYASTPWPSPNVRARDVSACERTRHTLLPSPAFRSPDDAPTRDDAASPSCDDGAPCGDGRWPDATRPSRIRRHHRPRASRRMPPSSFPLRREPHTYHALSLTATKSGHNVAPLPKGALMQKRQWHPERGDLYGRSPAMEVLPLIKEWNALPPEERAEAAARFVEWRLQFEDD